MHAAYVAAVKGVPFLKVGEDLELARRWRANGMRKHAIGSLHLIWACFARRQESGLEV